MFISSLFYKPNLRKFSGTETFAIQNNAYYFYLENNKKQVVYQNIEVRSSFDVSCYLTRLQLLVKVYDSMYQPPFFYPVILLGEMKPRLKRGMPRWLWLDHLSITLTKVSFSSSIETKFGILKLTCISRIYLVF